MKWEGKKPGCGKRKPGIGGSPGGWQGPWDLPTRGWPTSQRWGGAWGRHAPAWGKGNRQDAWSLPAQPQPQPEPEPPTGAGGLQRQRAIEAPDPAGGGESRRPKLFWDLQTQSFSPDQPRRLTPHKGIERVLRARNQPPGLGAHTQQHATTHTCTHIQCSRCHTGTHTPTQVCMGTGVSCVRAHRLTHRCTYTLGTSHTRSPSCNTAGSSST